MSAAVECKDRLLEMLNANDPETLLDNIDKVLLALELTSGIWQEASYAYKGSEIASRCRDILSDAQINWCMNWKRRDRVEAMKMKAWNLSELLHKLQHQQFANA